MTVYELIQKLCDYDAEDEIQFDVGSLNTDDCELTEKDMFYGGEHHKELHIELK